MDDVIIKRIRANLRRRMNDDCFHFVRLILRVVSVNDAYSATDSKNKHGASDEALRNAEHEEDDENVGDDELIKNMFSRNEKKSKNIKGTPQIFMHVNIDHSGAIIVPIMRFYTPANTHDSHHSPAHQFFCSPVFTSPSFSFSTLFLEALDDDEYRDDEEMKEMINYRLIFWEALKKHLWSWNLKALEQYAGKVSMTIRQMRLNKKWISFKKNKERLRNSKVYNDKNHKVFRNDCMNGGSVLSDGSCCCLATSYHGSKCHIGKCF